MRGRICGLVLAGLGLVACDTGRRAVEAVYDPFTRQLIRIDADTNGDGKIDARSYMRGTTVFRTEIDADGDGRIDRWEYVAAGRVVRIGMSSANDGIEDVWRAAADGADDVLLERAPLRDRRASRREFYRDDELLRAEEDTSGDGMMDKWETFEAGRLRTVAYDAAGGGGRPDRRLVYDAAGRFAHMEFDEDGDGVFVRK
jgi:hypothetical protein